MEKPQLEKFKQAARDLECDDDPVRFDMMVKKIAVAGGKRSGGDEAKVQENSDE